jgi:hypothetical protein
VEECFSKNSTLERVERPPSKLIEWFVERNRICNEMKVSKEQKNSIPRNMKPKNFQHFLKELRENSKELRAMKLVVLGDGRIGKTTLLNAMKSILDMTEPKVN